MAGGAAGSPALARVLLLVGLGGAAGSILRYLVWEWMRGMVPGPFPAGTLAVNVAGCFLVGFLGALLAGPVSLRPEYRLALLVGVLGGFTTFSTYGYETLSLLGEGRGGLALANVVLSNALGLAGVWLGHGLAGRFAG